MLDELHKLAQPGYMERSRSRARLTHAAVSNPTFLNCRSVGGKLHLAQEAQQERQARPRHQLQGLVRFGSDADPASNDGMPTQPAARALGLQPSPMMRKLEITPRILPDAQDTASSARPASLA